jgi:hypothetical protein
MAWLGRRYIERTRKPQGASSEHDVRGVGGDFGYLPVEEVAEHIQNNWYTYYARALGEEDVRVFAVGGGDDRSLRSEADRTRRNNLVNLPDC